MLNGGIIGCGRIAPNHILPLQKNSNVLLAWTCDLDLEKAQQIAGEYHIPQATSRVADVLEDQTVDFVCILTDHRAHYPLVKQALQKGKNVIVEKPFTLDITQADELVDLAESSGLRLICISQHRFDPMINQIRSLVQSETMGTILLVNARLLCGRAEAYYTESYWHGLAELDGGSALINQGYHIFDIVCSLFGTPLDIHAFADRRLHTAIIETEDTLTAQFRFENGALGSLNITSALIREDWDPTIEIISTRGRILFDLCFPHRPPIIAVEGIDPGALDPNQSRSQALGINGYYGNLHELQINDFIEALVNKRQPAFDPRNAVDTLHGIQRIYQNSQDNGFTWGKVTRKIRTV